MNAVCLADRRAPRQATHAALNPRGLNEVEDTMTRLTRPWQKERIGEMAHEQLACGGKRLRARLALSAAHTLGAREDEAIIWAAAVELLHNATLIHDDVQDGDRTRRGRPALWVRHGVPQALNAGNFMLMLPYLALAELPGERRADLSTVLAEHAIATARGQVAELDLLPEDRLDWSSYAVAASGKTGAMFSLPVVGAAILAGRPPEVAARLGAHFIELGLLFQIYDDIIDIYGDKQRDTRGSDLYEGKVSALVVEHLARRPADKAWLVELLQAPREATCAASVVKAIEAFQASGAAHGAVDRMEAVARRALSAPALAAEPGLLTIAKALVERCAVPNTIELEGVA